MRGGGAQVVALVLAGLAGAGGGAALAQDAPPLSVVEPDPARDDQPAPQPGPPPQPPVVAPTDLTVETAAPPLADPAMQVLTVDQNALFTQSAWGRRLQAEFERRGARLEAENKRLVEQLSAEEAELTELRKTLPPEEFRTRADAFDSRATRIRRERAQAVQDLNVRGEAEQEAFFRATVPVMGRLMQDLGAVAVLDRRSVLISVEAIDITDELIARIDAELGDGSDQPAIPPAPEDAVDGTAGGGTQGEPAGTPGSDRN